MIEQTDRDAAAELLISLSGMEWYEAGPVAVQAFAAHRIAAEQRGREAGAKAMWAAASKAVAGQEFMRADSGIHPSNVIHMLDLKAIADAIEARQHKDSAP